MNTNILLKIAYNV